MTNRISTVLDIDDKGFRGSLKSIGTAVGEADGFFGKFKAGATAAMDSVKANAGAFALAAGTSLVAFGVKAVGAFTDVAKSAIDLSTSTGLSIDEASRWIGVADDYEVKADALATGLGKVSKTLDNTKWAKYGIDTRDASGHARSANDILLDTFDVLSKVDNKTEQARIGQELFGKGYQSLTPILGHTREEYEAMLGAVEDGQVITAEEAEKSEEWRLAQDSLKDALHEVTLEVGEQVAGLAPLLEGFAKYVELTQQAGFSLNPLQQLSGVVDDVKESWRSFHGENTKAAEVLAGTTIVTDAQTGAAERLGTATDTGTDAAEGLTVAQAATKGATEALKAATEEATRKSDYFAASLQTQIDKLDALYPKEYSAVTAKYDYRDAQSAALVAVDNMNLTLGDNQAKQEDVTAATNNARDAIISQSEKYAILDGATLGSQGAIARQITSLEAQRDTLAPGSPLRLFLDEYISDLNNIPSNISTIMDLNISSGQVTTNQGDVIGKRSGARASGGPVKAGGNYVVGEDGPEVVHMNGSGTVIPNDKLGGDTNITINMPVGTNGDDVVRAIKKFEARNGPGWRS